MSGEAVIRFTGNTTGPAQIKFLGDGAACTSFTVAVTGRRNDKASGQWVDTEVVYYRVTAWRQMGESVAETLTDKGTRVTVEGRITKPPRVYEANGEHRVSLDVEADEVGLSLRFASAQASRTSRQGTQQAQGSTADPWAAAAPAASTAPPF